MVVIVIAYMILDLNGITKNDEYALYQIPFVENYQQEIVLDARLAYQKFQSVFEQGNSTWSYAFYNLFSITVGSPYFYHIYRCIVAAIRDRVGDDRPLWMQCWLNYHKMDEVLSWHHHHTVDFITHGYLSIDPKNTVTEFKEFTIENTAGKLYIGNPGLEHRVVVREPFQGDRITIAFDVKEYNHDSSKTNNLSFIPIP